MTASQSYHRHSRCTPYFFFGLL